ncbi:MAG: hypothetical protein AVDCRST_MAG73-2348 [uncultured Thermomicrobiales bacterium]|uniref:Uncharacterized protein n=1 Tax=uncultured Thermomicrobiales bacterium TaxID=1645740 RepID=A0A6J4UAE0_9BACT|nr:MAG: hypothetical protein AVDCRST_MAG73-2348 [uncultured Thermomicrobiales bacterium]
MSLASPGSAQRAIADHLWSVAAWRRAKAEEYDRDARNLRTAAGLDDLAAHVLALPDDDPRLRELARVGALHDDAFVPGQQTSYEIGRFRFHRPETGLDAFLDRLVELAIADRGEQGRFGGLMPEGDDPWG